MRTYRIRSGLTQRDVALLLGLKTGSTISRTERGYKAPSIQILLGYCLLFEAHPKELVPGIYGGMEKFVYARTNVLTGQLRKRHETPVVSGRINFLEKLSQLLERRLPQRYEE
jgi:transcriptional regulator with XRE-family HTH domain